jgi:hypothetical protein
MAVPVTEFKHLDVPHAGLDGIADRAGSGARESRLSVLLPDSVQGLEPRCREGIAGLIEPLVQVVARYARRRARGRSRRSGKSWTSGGGPTGLRRQRQFEAGWNVTGRLSRGRAALPAAHEASWQFDSVHPA